MSLSDQYIFLGIQQKFYFFQHLVNSELNLDMSGQIMNVLIDQNRINNQESVIIYEINSNTEKVDVVYIRHVNGQSIFLDKENLVNQYKRLISSIRKDSFLISTDGNRYESREIPLSFICEDIDLDGFYINEIHEMITNKQICKSLGEIQFEYDKFQKIWNKIKSNHLHPRYEECSKIFISTFKIFERHDKIVTISSLSDGVSTYLPKTSIISLFDKFGRVRMFTFDSFLEIMKLKSFNIKDKKDIIYYVCNKFPTEDEINLMVPYNLDN